MAVTPTIHVTRAYEFRGVHSLLTGPRRERTHGHRYVLEITLAARDDRRLDRIVADLVQTPLHGHVLDDLTDGPSTGERLVEWIDERLRTSEVAGLIRAVTLRETAKNRFVSAKSEDRYV